jgi:hypothetical protein
MKTSELKSLKVVPEGDDFSVTIETKTETYVAGIHVVIDGGKEHFFPVPMTENLDPMIEFNSYLYIGEAINKIVNSIKE